jgi:hypothetical protein
MTLHTEIEATETVPRQAVSTALKNYSLWLIISHNGLNDRLKNGLVRRIINTVSEREIDSVVLASANSNVAKLTSTRKVLAVLVKRDSHDSVRGIKGFFNAIAMVDIDVDIQDPLFEAEKLNNAENDVYKSSTPGPHQAGCLNIPLT